MNACEIDQRKRDTYRKKLIQFHNILRLAMNGIQKEEIEIADIDAFMKGEAILIE